MVEWGRLLSGYRGEILGRRFESCPPRHMRNAFREGRVLLSVTRPHGEDNIQILSFPSLENALCQERVLLSVARPHGEGNIRSLSSLAHEKRPP